MTQPSATPAERRRLRRELRQRRNALSGMAQRRAAQRLACIVSLSATFRRARHIAIYLANDGELDPASLATIAWHQGKYVYLPCLRHDGSLLFARYTPHVPLVRNRLGIPEPRPRKLLPLSALDCVYLPLVGFDRWGNRLGMGGGFYDRSFQQRRRPRVWRHPFLVGIAHRCQEVDRLSAAPWDVPLDAIATDAELVRPPRRSPWE